MALSGRAAITPHRETHQTLEHSRGPSSARQRVAVTPFESTYCLSTRQKVEIVSNARDLPWHMPCCFSGRQAVRNGSTI
jgi:hypothetical protein